MPSKSKVYFFFQKVRVSLQNRSALKRFIESVFKKEGKSLQRINFIFCTDKALLDINRQFLKHNFYTDIITFDLSEYGEIFSEVYISVDRVRENAKEMGITFKSELHRVIFHGVLHLCGYGDKSNKEIMIMRGKENDLIAQYLNK